MIRVLIFFLFISCQKSWTINEQNDFINRCKKNKLTDIADEKYQEFCGCLLKNSLNLDVSYNDFLKKDLDSDKINAIIQSCVD